MQFNWAFSGPHPEYATWSLQPVDVKSGSDEGAGHFINHYRTDSLESPLNMSIRTTNHVLSEAPCAPSGLALAP